MNVGPAEAVCNLLLVTCRVLGVKSLEASYNGSGDSGDSQIDTLFFTSQVSEEHKKMTESLLLQMYEDLVIESGYENNSGGYGSINVDVAAGTIDMTDAYNSEEGQETETCFDGSTNDLITKDEPYWRYQAIDRLKAVMREKSLSVDDVFETVLSTVNPDMLSYAVDKL